MIDGWAYRQLEQVLEEVELLRSENKTLKQNLSKVHFLFKEIKKLLEKYKVEEE